jgi:two-component system cell cycle sensor histidine kinase/response regulator CckA
VTSAAEKILSALNQLGPLLDQLEAGVQFIDEGYHYRYLNRAAALHGQRDGSELLGRTMGECYPGIEQTEMFSRIAATLKLGRLDALENEFTFPDGTQGWFEIQLYSVPGGVIIVSFEITHRKRLEVHLRHAQRMEATAQLAGGMAHEFNNILLIVRSFTELVSLNETLSEDGVINLKEVLLATDRASDLTQKLLSIARHTGGTPQRFDLPVHFEGFASTLAATLGEGIYLSFDISPEAGIVQLDPHVWEQTLASLALNARDAMQGRGRLTMEARRVTVVKDTTFDGKKQPLVPGEYVCFSVQDEGPGITPEIIDKIFDPFFSTKGRAGSGLGLSTCWGNIERTGGTIEVRSEKGEGACFLVYLPRKASLSSDSLPPPKSYPQVRRKTGYDILLVDDESSILRSVSGLLEGKGHRVASASSGQEALERLKRGGIQIVVSDVLMPGMSGIDLARQIENLYRDLPVLLMSGYSPGDLSMSQAQRFPLLAKPFRAKQLLEAIDKLLSCDA